MFTPFLNTATHHISINHGIPLLVKALRPAVVLKRITSYSVLLSPIKTGFDQEKQHRFRIHQIACLWIQFHEKPIEAFAVEGAVSIVDKFEEGQRNFSFQYSGIKYGYRYIRNFFLKFIFQTHGRNFEHSVILKMYGASKNNSVEEL